MLAQLYIENIAVIEKASIDFQKGFNILTGETGAGKSIIIDSINAVLGGRISKEIVRTGAKAAQVSALFTAPTEETSAKAGRTGISVGRGRKFTASTGNPCGGKGCLPHQWPSGYCFHAAGNRADAAEYSWPAREL